MSPVELQSVSVIMTPYPHIHLFKLTASFLPSALANEAMDQRRSWTTESTITEPGSKIPKSEVFAINQHIEDV